MVTMVIYNWLIFLIFLGIMVLELYLCLDEPACA